MNYLQDNNGNKSSKRLWGTVCMIVGLTMAMSITAIYMIMAIGDVHLELGELNSIFYAVFGASTSLLVGGTFEKRSDGKT